MGPIRTEWGYPGRLRWWLGWVPWLLGVALLAGLLVGALLAVAPWGHVPAGYPRIAGPDGVVLTPFYCCK